MDRTQAEFFGGLRKHVHDHIVGRYDPRYALTSSGWETRRTMSVAARIDAMEDRLFDPTAMAAGLKRPVGEAMGGALRQARMFDPRGKVEAQEQMLSRSDQEELLNLAALMRGIAGETKAWLGAAFKGVPAGVELVRQRREGRLPAAEEGLSPAVREMLAAWVVDEDSDEPVKKIVDDGDVFNDFKAGLGALRQAWLKIAMAMITGPVAQRPDEPELAAAFAVDGIELRRGELGPMEATPNKARPNYHGFGWPRAAVE